MSARGDPLGCKKYVVTSTSIWLSAGVLPEELYSSELSEGNQAKAHHMVSVEICS